MTNSNLLTILTTVLCLASIVLLILIILMKHRRDFLKNCFILSFALFLILACSNTQTFNDSYQDMAERINIISENLVQASEELLLIETELNERIALVNSLQEEADIATTVIKMTDEEVQATLSLLNKEYRAGNKSNTCLTIIVGLFSLIFGWLLPEPPFKKKKHNDAQAIHNKYSDEQIAQAIALLDSMQQTQQKNTEDQSKEI